jgi:CAAX prenyl protease-like protein
MPHLRLRSIPRMLRAMTTTDPTDSAVPPREDPAALWAHAVPFLAWIALMHFLDLRQLPPAWAYVLRSLACLGLLLYLRPWRWYPRLDVRNLPLAAGIGVAVFAVWVVGESDVLARWPAIQDLYLRWGVRPFGELRPAIEATPFAPDVCGWPLTVARIAGSGLVIGVIEEFFWRGFLYRWLVGLDFTRVELGRFAALPFFLVAAMFAAEHTEWLAGLVAGLLYGWLFLRTRDLWAAAAAHALTNLLLGVYVVFTRSYQFW